MLRPAVLFAALFTVCVLSSGRAVAAPGAEGAAPVSPAGVAKAPNAERAADLEDSPQPLLPKRPRSEAETDRVQALALFAAGRMAEQKQDYPAALRLYQRALRSDPSSLPVLREIVPLAFNLNRHGEAVRYALMVVEKEPTDPVLLRRLALYLTEEGDFERALKLYEKAATLQATAKPSAATVALWLEMGRVFYAMQKPDRAAEEFAKVVQALDKPAEYGLDEAQIKTILGKPELTWQLIAESFLDAGRTAEAAAAFEKVNAAKKGVNQLAFNLARVELKKKDPAAALVLLQKYFDAHQSSEGTGPYQALAEALEQQGKANELVDTLVKIRQEDQNNIPLAYFLAQQYRQAGKLDLARPIYTHLLEIRKQRPPVEAYQGLVDVYRREQNADELLSVLGSAVEKTGSLTPLADEGKALVADQQVVDKIFDTAKAKKAADAAKLSYGQLLAVGLLALELEKWDVAEEFFNAAIVADSQRAAEALLTWGLELFMAKQYEASAKVFQRGVKDAVLPANNPAFYFYLAGALEMCGQTDAALEAARKAAESQKDSPRFQSRVAWILYHAKRNDQARQAYQALIDQFDKTYDSTEIRDVLREARLVLSNICVAQQEMPQSEEWLEQVLDEFPEDVGAQNDLGYLWADQNKHLERALRMTQHAVAGEPKNMAYRDSLGWAFYRLGRYAEAVAELKIAASVDEPDGLIYDHLADALIKSGDKAAAIENWNKAIAAFEKAKESEKIPPLKEKIVAAQK